jgi:phenylalanyl-tRNA synthetase beta chain
VGEIHPLVAAEWEIKDTVGAFELDLDAVQHHARVVPMYVDVTTFPAVREDLAVIVSDETPAATVLATVTRAGAPLLESVYVFDVYRDAERIGAGNVSLALALSYRAPDRTLTDEEVAAKRRAIIDALDTELGGRIRGGS